MSQITVLRTSRFAVTVELPQATRKRLITTTSMASALTALWIAAPAYLPGAELSFRLVAEGLLVPFGVGYFSLFFAERRARRDLKVAERQDYGKAIEEARR